MVRLKRSPRVMAFFGLVSAVALVGAACSGNGHKSGSGIDLAPSTSRPTTTMSTTTTPDTAPPDSGPGASPSPTPGPGNSLDSLLGTFEAACANTGQATSVCLCMTDRIRNAERANQSLDELSSELRQIMRACMKEH